MRTFHPVGSFDPNGPVPMLLRVVTLSVLLATPATLPAEESTTPAPTAPSAPARLSVSGFGLLGNRALRAAIRELLPAPEAPTLEANLIEDAFVLLHARLGQEGHLHPTLVANVTLTNGQVVALWWEGEEEVVVPRDLQATEAHFHVIRGVLFHYAQLEFEGLTVMPAGEARAFFFPRDELLRRKHSRPYSPERLRRSLANLERELHQRGYREARGEVTHTELSKETGAVNVRVKIVEGPQLRVRSLALSPAPALPRSLPLPERIPLDQPFSLTWEQDAAYAIKQKLHREGYPDAQVRLLEMGRQPLEGVVQLDLAADVTPGQQVELGEVRFEGQRHARESFLRRRVRLEGPLLDRVEVDRARERLSRLGSFRFVGVRLEPATGSPRDVVFELTEGQRYELSLIAGYGSYDQLFGGAEFQHFNLWNIGHHARLRAVQSFKSTQGTFVYAVPEVLATGLNLYGSADGFRREELTFDREEVKFALGLRKQFPRSGHQAGVRYSYEFLDAETAAVGNEATRAAALIADWQMDQRDNPLLPRRGTRVFANLELAQPAFGGEAEYARLELGASHHHAFGRGLILHLGLQQSLVTSPDRAASLPFNKRFFPGGENSVRGYQRGGASPLDANGNQLGAESALQWNLELEQQLVRSVSIVAFMDGAGVTPVVENFPFDEVLWSVGLGARWNTLIGPVRLEYGHNLTPRAPDPAGTLHLSIGYPF